jgi:hypothetical protein
MRMKASRTVLAAAAALVAATTLSATPAVAAPEASGDCNWNGGTYICADGILGPYTFPTGQVEYWVIGTSHAVWTYWNDVHGGWHWTSLGGYADSGASYVYYSGWAVTIEVIGSNHNSIYCDDRGDTQSSGWGRWYEC